MPRMDHHRLLRRKAEAAKQVLAHEPRVRDEKPEHLRLQYPLVKAAYPGRGGQPLSMHGLMGRVHAVVQEQNVLEQRVSMAAEQVEALLDDGALEQAREQAAL